MDFDFQATERGNILLSNEEGGYNSWLRIKGDKWLQMSIRPENYPALNVSTIELTDEELAEHIQKECAGMAAMRCCLAQVEIDSDNCVAEIETEEQNDDLG